MTRTRKRPTAARQAKARAPRAVFPFAVTLRAAALIFEGDGRPALYVSTDGHAGQAQVFRVPDDCRVTVTAPRPLPDAPRVFLPAGSCATFQHGEARTVLALHAVRVCRELLEAVEGHAQAAKVWKEARAHFEGKPGEEEDGQPRGQQGAA